MASASSEKPFSFFKLPPELRNAIYAMHLNMGGTSIDLFEDPLSSPRPEDGVNFLVTCRKVYEELSDVSAKRQRTLRLWTSCYRALNTLISPTEGGTERFSFAGGIPWPLGLAHLRSTITTIHLNLDFCSEIPRHRTAHMDQFSVANCLVGCYPAWKSVQMMISWYDGEVYMRGDEVKAETLDPLLKFFLRPLVRGFPQSVEFSFLDQYSIHNTSTISVKKLEKYLKDALLERLVIQEGMLSSLQPFLSNST